MENNILEELYGKYNKLNIKYNKFTGFTYQKETNDYDNIFYINDDKEIYPALDITDINNRNRYTIKVGSENISFFEFDIEGLENIAKDNIEIIPAKIDNKDHKVIPGSIKKKEIKKEAETVEEKDETKEEAIEIPEVKAFLILDEATKKKNYINEIVEKINSPKTTTSDLENYLEVRINQISGKEIRIDEINNLSLDDSIRIEILKGIEENIKLPEDKKIFQELIQKSTKKFNEEVINEFKVIEKEETDNSFNEETGEKIEETKEENKEETKKTDTENENSDFENEDEQLNIESLKDLIKHSKENIHNILNSKETFEETEKQEKLNEYTKNLNNLVEKLYKKEQAIFVEKLDVLETDEEKQQLIDQRENEIENYIAIYNYEDENTKKYLEENAKDTINKIKNNYTKEKSKSKDKYWKNYEGKFKQERSLYKARNKVKKVTKNIKYWFDKHPVIKIIALGLALGLTSQFALGALMMTNSALYNVIAGGLAIKDAPAIAQFLHSANGVLSHIVGFGQFKFAGELGLYTLGGQVGAPVLYSVGQSMLNQAIVTLGGVVAVGGTVKSVKGITATIKDKINNRKKKTAEEKTEKEETPEKEPEIIEETEKEKIKEPIKNETKESEFEEIKEKSLETKDKTDVIKEETKVETKEENKMSVEDLTLLKETLEKNKELEAKLREKDAIIQQKDEELKNQTLMIQDLKNQLEEIRNQIEVIKETVGIKTK